MSEHLRGVIGDTIAAEFLRLIMVMDLSETRKLLLLKSTYLFLFLCFLLCRRGVSLSLEEEKNLLWFLLFVFLDLLAVLTNPMPTSPAERYCQVILLLALGVEFSRLAPYSNFLDWRLTLWGAIFPFSSWQHIQYPVTSELDISLGLVFLSSALLTVE